MDVGFKEVGITFLVGAFTILGFGMIFYYIFDRSLAGFLRDHLEPIFKNNRSEAENIPGIHDRYYFLLHIAILIGFSFAVGIIVESLSEKYKDNTPLLFRTLFVSIGAELERFSIDAEEFGFPINEDDRVTVVVGFKDIGDGFTIMEPTPLGYELAAHDALVKGEVKEEGKKTVDEIEDKLMMCYLVYTECKNKPDCTIKQFCKVETKNAKDLVCKIRPDEKQKLTGLVTALYYRSKNVTYSYPNYYDEMSRIQMRQDFARSLSLF